MNKLFLFFAVALLALASSLAWRFYGPLPDGVVARVNGDDISVAALDVFVTAAQRRDASLDRKALLTGLIENRLLATLADHSSSPETSVGYDRASQLEQQRFRLIRSAFGEPLSAAMQASGASSGLDFLTAPPLLDPARLAPLLNLQQQLSNAMTPQQQAAAKALVLARFRFRATDTERELTLWDLYRRQNVQLKVQMHNLNVDFIRQAINQFMVTAYVLDWFETASGLDRESRAEVERCIDDAIARQQLLAQLGVEREMHDDNPALRDAAAQVSAAEVKAYYLAHQDQFTRVQRVHAYHIRLAQQQQADHVYARLQAGMPFADAISQYSQAPDAASGGELGWIDRDSRQSHWTLALAFVQPQGQISPPFRSPDDAGEQHWELLLVDQKEMAVQALDSESVHYRAANAIAAEKLAARFKQLLATTRANARIRYNEELI